MSKTPGSGGQQQSKKGCAKIGRTKTRPSQVAYRSSNKAQINHAKAVERELKRQARVQAKHAKRAFDGKPIPNDSHGTLTTPQLNLSFFLKKREAKQRAKHIAEVRIRKDGAASAYSIAERIASLHPEFVAKLAKD